MSKAFTSDDTAIEPLPGVLPEHRRAITKDGLLRLQRQLKHLIETTRPKFARLAAEGDVHGKMQLRLADISMRRLQRVISLCDPVTLPKEAPKRVVLGCRAKLQDDGGRTKSVTVVGPDELDHEPSNISYQAPLGRALLGLSVGAWAVVERPKDTVEWQVVAIDVP